MPSDSPHEPVVSLSCVNFCPIEGDKRATLAKMEANIAEAAAQGANIVAFPEEALVGASACAACRAEAGPCEEHIELADAVLGVFESRQQVDQHVVANHRARE